MIWDRNLCGTELRSHGTTTRHRFYLPVSRWAIFSFVLLLFLSELALPALGKGKDGVPYGEGLIVNIPLPEPEVAQVVDEVSQNTIIRGTKEYAKDEYVAGAAAAPTTAVFPKWTDPGKVFYKVRKQALDPVNFKNSSDVGTLAVRYVVQPQGINNTVLRIDALFVEDFRRRVHESNGSVENAEYKDIQDRLASIELVKKETAEALRAKRERFAKQNLETSSSTETDSDNSGGSNDGTVALSTPPPMAEPGTQFSTQASSQTSTPSSAPDPWKRSSYDQSSETLEQHVANLRRQVERLVKQPGAPLKSAPFHTASTLKSLEPGAEVLILISTTYWYGVETHDGQHGWIQRDQLEQAP